MYSDDYIIDEFGRFWLIDDDGKPYSGPYDTLEEVEEALRPVEDDET